jgi:hypothetical protein
MIPLINYLMATTRQAVTHIQSHGDSNRCIPCRGKPDTHDMYAFLASPCMSLIRFLRAVPVRDNLSWVINNVGQSHCSRENGTPDYIPSTPIDRFVGPHPVSLLLTTIEAVEKVKHLLATSYIDLLGPYHQYVTSTFDTCSRIPNPRSLTNIGGGYNLGGASFPHHTPRPSQLMVLRFPLRAPPGLTLTCTTKASSKLRVKHLAVEWPPCHPISTKLTITPSIMLMS